MASPWALLLLLAAEPLPEWDARFDRDAGWTGADGAYSAGLGDGRILWLFGDTFIDRYGGSPRMIRNSVAIQRGDAVDFVESELFHPPGGEGWIWPGAAIVADGRLHLLLNEFREAGRTDVWNFRFARSWLGTVADFSGDPRTWAIDYRNLPSGPCGVAALVDGDSAWIYSTHDEEGRRTWRVRRAPADRVGEIAAWGEESADLFPQAGAEGSVSRDGDRFVAVYTENGLSDRILMRTAPSPDGPWGDPLEIYRCPEAAWDRSFLCYAAKGHPELSRPGDLVVTYAVNSTDFGAAIRDRRIYRPRFVRVPLP